MLSDGIYCKQLKWAILTYIPMLVIIIKYTISTKWPVNMTPKKIQDSLAMRLGILWYVIAYTYGSGHEVTPVLLPGFAIKW